MLNDHIPLYQQVYTRLKQEILQNKYEANQPLPSQNELSKRFDVSEITMRRALTELSNERLIYRVRGKGTFVKAAGNESDIKEDLLRLNRIYLAFPKLNLQALNQWFYNDLISGIDDFCQEYGIDFRFWEFATAGGLPTEEDAGVVLMPQFQTPISKLEKWREEVRHLVTVHVYYPHLQIPFVIVDNLTGGYTATQHLLTLGHRRIGIILTGNSELDLNQEFSLRFQGYKLALEQNHIEFDESLVSVEPGGQELEMMGYNGMKKLLDRTEWPTAVFATSDNKAIGCMKAVKERGLRVPEDISIIGYDNVPIGKYLTPSLTTIDQNAYSMGRRAAEILAFKKEEEGKNREQFKDEIVPKLIIRESTAPCRTSN